MDRNSGKDRNLPSKGKTEVVPLCFVEYFRFLADTNRCCGVVQCQLYFQGCGWYYIGSDERNRMTEICETERAGRQYAI